MPYLFSSESVSEGHPDKVADQISDAILDEFLRQDPASRVACETLVTTNHVLIAGEFNSRAKVEYEEIVRRTIDQIGYNNPDINFDASSCHFENLMHGQSSDIARGVDRTNEEGESETGAGDQGMMFGYAVNETANYMPLGLDLAHLLLRELSDLRRSGQEMTYLRPDAKSQVTIKYSDDHKPLAIDNIVLSTQHDEFESDVDKMQAKIQADIRQILIPRVIDQCPADIRAFFNEEIRYQINPTGNFVIGGPDGDTGLTGRKIIVDTYGGHGAHGGGAFSGKDSSKVDRSGAYASRHIARNLVAAGVADRVLVQIAYAIGVETPVSVYVNTFGGSKLAISDGELAQRLSELFDLRPKSIIQDYKLDQPIFQETASYGHMGRTPGKRAVDFGLNGTENIREVDTFTWERENRVGDIRSALGL